MSKRKNDNSAVDLFSKKLREDTEKIGDNKDNKDVIMYCWGSTIHGELGLGGLDHDHITSPQELPFKEAPNVKHVSCGDSHTMMLTSRGELYSCGNNDHGQLGHTKARTKPELVDKLSSYNMSSVSCGGSHTLACNEWWQLFGWGSDAHGQLGLNGEAQTTPKIVKSLATSLVVQAVCGQTHSLALTNTGDLYAWGGNGHGQLGLGRQGGSQNIPEIVASLKGVPIALIACGAYHSFAVTKSGAVFGWGLNTKGQLGLNDTKTRLYPTQLRTHRTFRIKYIACGEDFSVFLSADGGVFTCGSGTYGQLGHGSSNNELLPRKVMELMGSTVTQISCGRRHTLALVPSRGHVFAFGLGACGQLGTRTSTNASTPQVVRGPWVSPSGQSIIGVEASSENVIVTSVYSGGDQCFVTVAKVVDNVEPEDRRILQKRTQVATIESEQISICRNILPNETVDQDILTYLENTFQSLNCLNASFLLADDEHYCCSSTNPGVDISKAQEIFTDISRIENETLKDLIWMGIVEGILPNLDENPPDVEALRVYVTLPLYHHFNNPKQAESLQGLFAWKVTRLQLAASKVIGRWWTGQSVEYFERLITIYKNVVAFHLRLIKPEHTGTIFFNSSMSHSLKLLAVLNALNNSGDEPKVPYNTFYIPELNLLDIQRDYINWNMSTAPPGDSLFFCYYPFLFDIQAKTAILRLDQELQMYNAISQVAAFSLLAGRVAGEQDHFLNLTVDRNNLVQSTIHQIMACAPVELKRPIKVTFIGEEAEDLGGVRKEFFLLVMKEVLDPKFGMFKYYEETRTIWFNEVCFEDDVMYSFIGYLCGLAIYNFTIIDLPFPLVLYKKILKEKVLHKDLKSLSPTMYKSLQDLLEYKESDFAEVFGLTFEISREVYGEVKIDELVEGGSKIDVTQENKQEFVDLYVDFVLNKSISNRFQAFNEGFHKVCGGKVLELFHAQELMALVVGNENYDWAAFESNAEYKNGYCANNRTIRIFWEVFHELTEEEKRMFLLFLTGSDRIPIQGMEAVKIRIQPMNDEKFLPVAHTCFNLLDLPEYRTKERLRYKLLQAIKHHQGFSLV